MNLSELLDGMIQFNSSISQVRFINKLNHQDFRMSTDYFSKISKKDGRLI